MAFRTARVRTLGTGGRVSSPVDRKGSIGRRLLVAVVLFSSMITLVTTGTQLFVDYRNEVGSIRDNLSQVESTYVPSLENSVWIADRDQIMILLDGLLALPDVQHVSLSVSGAGSFEVGRPNVEKALTETYALRRVHRGDDLLIGTLVISASVQPVIERLIDRAVVILVGNGVKTFLVAGFILLIFHLFVTRHLSALSRYARELSIGESTAPVELPRRKRAVPDELDELAQAISGITSRVQTAYRMLQDSEQRFRDYAEASSDWFWETGPDLRISDVSEQHSAITGIDRSVFVGRRRDEFPGLIIDPNRLAEHQLVMERRLPFRDFVYAMRTPDGTVKHFQTSGRPRWDSEGRFLGYRGIARDITAAFMADEARQRTELQLARAIEAVPAACALFDEDDGLIICNKTYRSLFDSVGLQVEAGDTFEMLIRAYANAGGMPGTSEEVDAWVARRLNRRQRPERNFEYLRADGHWAEVSDYVLDDGRVLHFAADVTARKNAEARAQAERTKAAEYLQVAQTIIVALNREGRVELLNQYGCDVLGYRLDEVLGNNWIDMVTPPDHLEEQHADFAAVVAGRQKLLEFAEHDIVTKNGELRRIAWRNSAVLDDSGNVVKTLSSGLDVTEHQAAEEALMQAQKMDAIGKLTGGIAHDFNNLLMGIQGNVSVMNLEIEDASPLQESLQSIARCVQSGSQLTNQLLAFARGGKYIVKPSDLNAIVKKSSDIFGRTKREINIHRVFATDIWPVEVDSGQIEQVLMNLFVNAWQAMPDGGDLFIAVENVELDEHYARIKTFNVRPGRYVKLSVTDSGVGMDAETRKRIFEPFFSTKEKGMGTGLGLASAYGIIKNHGGFINCYSEPGQGTTFNIYFPESDHMIETEEHEADDDLKSGVPRGTETILFVDDDEENLAVGRKILAGLGYRVLTAHDGKTSLEIYTAQGDQIDMVVLDYVMPGMGGREVFEALRRLDPDVRVLLSSGYSSNNQVAHMLDQGCKGFIQKPYDAGRMARKMREILDS